MYTKLNSNPNKPTPLYCRVKMETLSGRGPYQLPLGTLIEVRVRAKNKLGIYGDWSDTNLSGVRVRQKGSFLKPPPMPKAANPNN